MKSSHFSFIKFLAKDRYQLRHITWMTVTQEYMQQLNLDEKPKEQ